MKKIGVSHAYKTLIFALTYGISFYYLKMFSKQDSWLIVIVGSFIGFLYIKMIEGIKNNYQNKIIYEINKIILGNTMGTITNIIFSSVFALLSIIISWYILIFLKTNFLEETPIIITITVLFLPIMYAINKSRESLIRSTVIFSFIILFLTIVSFIFLIPQIEISNFKPFEEIEPINMLKGLFCFTTTTFLPTYAIKEKFNLKISNAINIFFTIFSIVFFTYSVLGNSIVEIVDFPEFFVLRKVGFSASGTRVDSLIIIGWFLSIYSTNMLFILFIKDYLKYEIKKYKNYYSYILVLSIYWLSFNIFKDVIIGKIFILKILPIILFCTLFILNFIIYLIIKVKQKTVSHKY